MEEVRFSLNTKVWEDGVRFCWEYTKLKWLIPLLAIMLTSGQ
jgi:hypothetical protein